MPQASPAPQRPAAPLLTVLAACLGLNACQTLAPSSPPLACDRLGEALSSLPQVRLTRTSAAPADDKGTPAHCLVQGQAKERTGQDGRRYAIGFEMRLPAAWNGRFLHQVNGGNDGKVLPALGNLGILGVDGLRRGFAVLSSDSGHVENDPANADAKLAQGNVFGLDPQARRDYGYTANDTLYPVAQTLIARHYGRSPERNYMAGCSNGGRHALVAATRYGDRYDGILAGAPALNLPKAAIQHAWDVQSWQMADPDIRRAFSPADMALVGRKVLERCDALDGLADGIVGDLQACQSRFKLADLQCAGDKTDACLSAQQVTALNRAFGGPRNSKGEQLYSEWSFDAGMGAPNWRFWKLESQIPPWDKLPLIATMGAGSLSYVFTTPPTTTPGTPAALLAFLTRFNFDTDAPRVYATDGIYTESAMQFMTPPDVDNPQLSTFRQRGGKLIVYHGHSDGVFSINDTQRWFGKLSVNAGAQATQFARLYGVPGMSHCSGGPATDQFDALGALVDWVEKGQAPAGLTAGLSPANKDVPADWSRSRTRLLCPWPQVARYQGGDAESAASFRCVAP